MDCRCFSFCHCNVVVAAESHYHPGVSFGGAIHYWTFGQDSHSGARTTTQEVDMLWTIFVALIILWLLGFTLHIGGGLIHLLLVVGLIVLVINLVGGRRSAI